MIDALRLHPRTFALVTLFMSAVFVLMGLRGLLEPEPPTATASMTALPSEAAGRGLDPETEVDAPKLALSTALRTIEVSPFVVAQVLRDAEIRWTDDEITRNIQVQGGETASFVDIAVMSPEAQLSLDLAQEIQDRLATFAERRIERLSPDVPVALARVTIVHGAQMLPVPDPRISLVVYSASGLVLSGATGVAACLGASRLPKGRRSSGSTTPLRYLR